MHTDVVVTPDLSLEPPGDDSNNRIRLTWQPHTGQFDITIPDTLGPLPLADGLLLLSIAVPSLTIIAQHQHSAPRRGLTWMMQPDAEHCSQSPFTPEVAFLNGEIRDGALTGLNIDHSLYLIHGAWFHPDAEPAQPGTPYLGRGVANHTATWHVKQVGSDHILAESQWSDPQGCAKLHHMVTDAPSTP